MEVSGVDKFSLVLNRVSGGRRRVILYLLQTFSYD